VTTETVAPPEAVTAEVPEPTGSRWARFGRHGLSSAARKPRPPLSSSQLVAAIVLATVLALALWFVFYAFVLSGVQEQHDQRVSFAHIREELALATVPIGGSIKPGAPVALISIPAVHLRNVVVVEGTNSAELEAGPGHFPATPLPGQAGDSLLLGRRSTFGGPFGSLAKLSPGSLIYVTTGQGSFTYTVTDLRIPGDPLPSVLAANQSRLTLLTSHGSGWGTGQPLYLDANLTAGKIQPTPAGAPSVVPTVDQPFHGDNNGLVPLVLWLQLMILFAAATAWCWWRWTKPQTWLVAVPAGLAILWGATSAVMPFLPNLT
jgi:sortase A